MTAVNFNMRLDQDLKDRAGEVLESYGLTTAQAVKLFLTQIVKTNTVPLSFDYNNTHRLSANGERLLRESIADFENGNFSEYHSVNELMDAMAEVTRG